jgi:hypothetical protein
MTPDGHHHNRIHNPDLRPTALLRRPPAGPMIARTRQNSRRAAQAGTGGR